MEHIRMYVFYQDCKCGNFTFAGHRTLVTDYCHLAHISLISG